LCRHVEQAEGEKTRPRSTRTTESALRGHPSSEEFTERSAAVLSKQRFTPGKRSSLFAVSLAAMLVWTQGIADPALAIHNRSRPFSIVADDRTVPGAPNSFTCRFIENENGVAVYDYRCRNRDKGFTRLLIGPTKSGQDDEALIATSATADPDRTDVFSPGRFTCKHDGGSNRLPGDFACKDDRGRNFTLADFAYVNHVNEQGEVESDLVYALPCRPCVELPE
jgi:hypothetical protein